MPLFRRSTPDHFAGLAEAVGHAVKPLAFGTGEGSTVLVGTREELALCVDGTWTSWPWETIAGGSWKGESRTFHWRTVEADEHEVVLEDANRLPQLFRERIEASTVVQSVIATDPGHVQVVGRRGLGSDETVRFYAVPSGGADLLDDATRAAIVAETDRLRAEYF